jgi:hypothetical protein
VERNCQSVKKIQSEILTKTAGKKLIEIIKYFEYVETGKT